MRILLLLTLVGASLPVLGCGGGNGKRADSSAGGQSDSAGSGAGGALATGTGGSRRREWFQRVVPEVSRDMGQRHPPSREWFQRFPETWGNGIRHPECLRWQRVPVIATSARNRSSKSGPGQKLMWWNRGLPSMTDAG